MNKEELEKEALTKYKTGSYPQFHPDFRAFIHGYLAGAEPREKRITNLEEKISILLSCKNCPDNKGGLLCQKEYEDKCLAQKIQYIKELKEENAELTDDKNKLLDVISNYEVKVADLEKENKSLENVKNIYIGDLLKAKRIINKLSTCFSSYSSNIFEEELLKEAEQFISEVSE